jgi:hypothetical protein
MPSRPTHETDRQRFTTKLTSTQRRQRPGATEWAGLFDANVAAWERRTLAAERYDFLVIDEVQEVTPVELRLALATLKEKDAFLLCGDSNQIVHPTSSPGPG